jgi:hypothetical protein
VILIVGEAASAEPWMLKSNINAMRKTASLLVVERLFSIGVSSFSHSYLGKLGEAKAAAAFSLMVIVYNFPTTMSCVLCHKQQA